MAEQDGTVAVLGVGAMGHGMAGSLLRAGVPTVVWNRHPDAVEELVERGARAGDTAAEAAREAAVVITMVTDADAVAEVADSMLDALPPRAVWAQMGTIGVAGTERAAMLATQRRPDVIFVDAPVAGSVGPAAAGELTIFASGPDAAREPLRPAFEAMGSRTLWLGPAGNGSRMKLMNNTVLALSAEAAAESMALAHRLGISTDLVLSALDGSPLQSPWMAGRMKRLARGEYSAQFPLKHALKDVRLALEQHPMPVLAALADQWQRAADAGIAGEDVTAVTLAYERPENITAVTRGYERA